MKFFVTTLSGWESLAVLTKKSILILAGVVDLPLLETEMSTFNKHRINVTEFY